MTEERSTEPADPSAESAGSAASADRPWRRWALPIVAALVVVALVVVAAMVSSRRRSGRAGVVDIRTNACAVRWPDRRSGRRTFQVTNHTRSIVGVEVAAIPSLAIDADIEMLAPGTTRPLTVTVGRGHYQWRCETLNGSTLDSATFTVTGAVLHRPTFTPASGLALLGAVATFQDSVVSGVAQLVVDTDRLTDAIDQGQLGPARGLWLTAHLDYERLGGAYDTFGDLDQTIDGRPDGLPGGVDDPAWTGFFRLERVLWGNQPLTVATTVVDALDRKVHELQSSMTTAATNPKDLVTRTHEILENGLQFELTGQTDQGSHTNLATLRAEVDGTRWALDAVTPLLQSMDPKLLATATADLDRVAGQLDAFRQPDGTWTPVTALTLAQHQELDGSISQTVEDLVPIPDVLELTPEASDD